MASRKGAIIQIAEKSSELIVEALPPERAVAKANYLKIAAVCRALVSRQKTPYFPTAALVAEEGGNADAEFPSARTIHNAYADMMRIWKRAYHDITNIMANDALSVDELPSVDLSDADANTKHVFDELYRHLKEVHQRNNALKKLITDNVPVDADQIPAGSSRIIDALELWLDRVRSGLFTLDEDGMKVSRKSAIGTIIMDTEMLNDLQTLVEDFRSVDKLRNQKPD